MESDNMDMGNPGSTLATSRWNPTKEQINMLENLYGQGIRTPSAEQIQQITSRLRVYGHIEGKNVFYWFQNHKARQRQKQKQERMAYINRYLHKTQPVFPPCTNVICSPYYLPRSDLGLYPQCTKLLQLPGGSKRRAKVDDQMEKARTVHGGLCCDSDSQHDYNFTMMQSNSNSGIKEFGGVYNNNRINQETLPLFPLHPTGILKGRRTTGTAMPSIGSTSLESCSATPSTSSETNTGFHDQDGSGDQPFFDFFSGQGCQRN